jgi:hypothetical protein
MGKKDVEPFYNAIAPQIYTDFKKTKGYALSVRLDEIEPISDDAA